MNIVVQTDTQMGIVLFGALLQAEMQKVRDLPGNAVEFRVVTYRKPLSRRVQFWRAYRTFRQRNARLAALIGAYAFLQYVRKLPLKEQA
jgi:hypothetical protein